MVTRLRSMISAGTLTGPRLTSLLDAILRLERRQALSLCAWCRIRGQRRPAWSTFRLHGTITTLHAEYSEVDLAQGYPHSPARWLQSGRLANGRPNLSQKMAVGCRPR